MKAKIHPAVAAVALPALIGLILIARIIFLSEQKRAEDLMQTYTESIAHGVSAFFIDAATIASVAVTLHNVQEFDWEKASMDLMALIRATLYINRMSLVDLEGNIYDVYTTGPIGNRWQGGRRTVDNSDPNADPVNISDHPHFRRLVTENTSGAFYTITSESYIMHGMHTKAFLTSAPIIKEGKAVGMIIVGQTSIELSQLYEDLTMDFLDKFGNSAHLFLVSRDGTLISSLEYNRTYRAYMDELFGEAKIVPVFVLGDDTANAIFEAIDEEKRVVEAELHNESHFLAGAKISNTPFAVCLAYLKSQMHYASRYIVLIGGGAFVVTAICVAIVFVAMSKAMLPRPKIPKKPRHPNR